MTALESGFFDSIGGLPMHPLVVHFAVVLLPVAAIALVVLVFVPSWADRFGWLTMGTLVVGTGAAFVAKQSGEALAAQVGNPAAHASWGDLLPLLAVGLLVLAGIWFFLHRQAGGAGKARSTATTIAGLLAAALAIGVTAVTVVVGHTGAEAAWGGIEAAASSDGPSGTKSQVPSASTSAKPSGKPASSSSSGSYTLADVAKHADATSCWSVVDGQVYDLTKWINQHPGGARRILAMCGRDGSASYNAQHGGQNRPDQILKQYKIGTLA